MFLLSTLSMFLFDGMIFRVTKFIKTESFYKTCCWKISRKLNDLSLCYVEEKPEPCFVNLNQKLTFEDMKKL